MTLYGFWKGVLNLDFGCPIKVIGSRFQGLNLSSADLVTNWIQVCFHSTSRLAFKHSSTITDSLVFTRGYDFIHTTTRIQVCFHSTSQLAFKHSSTITDILVFVRYSPDKGKCIAIEARFRASRTQFLSTYFVPHTSILLCYISAIFLIISKSNFWYTNLVPSLDITRSIIHIEPLQKPISYPRECKIKG